MGWLILMNDKKMIYWFYSFIDESDGNVVVDSWLDRGWWEDMK